MKYILCSSLLFISSLSFGIEGNVNNQGGSSVFGEGGGTGKVEDNSITINNHSFVNESDNSVECTYRH